ncbi:hypothetical protein AB4305_22230 [Nocardia sp. 2YAB30]|uniref:hypothetical protein n=1 Tax=unclassified Nocardia TaxID=2637762 RepID=UPI003F9BF64F
MRAGHVSAAALIASTATQSGRRTGRHCPRTEYVEYVRSQNIVPSYRNDKLRYYREFMERYPMLSDWYAAPLVERVGRLPGESQKNPSYPLSFRARPYLLFLAFHGYAVFDYAWTLGAGQLRVIDPAAKIGIDMGTDALVEEAVALGFDRESSRQAMHWTVSRIAMHTGIFDASLIVEQHIAELLDAVRRFSEREDLRYFYPSPERYRDNASKQWITCTNCTSCCSTAARSPPNPAKGCRRGSHHWSCHHECRSSPKNGWPHGDSPIDHPQSTSWNWPSAASANGSASTTRTSSHGPT